MARTLLHSGVESSVFPTESIATSGHSVDGTFVAMENAHYASIADADQPRAVWTPRHLRGGEMVLLG